MAPGHADEALVKQNFFENKGLITEESQNYFVGKMITQTRDTLDSLVTTLTTPWINFKVSEKDEDCLARNIYYEAATESEEGKTAVGIVTINRVRDGRFGNSICNVVNQRTVFVKTREVKEEIVQRGFFGLPEKSVQTRVEMTSVPVCQFSWVCAFVRKPKVTDARWEESQRISRELLAGGYDSYRAKYENALFFHSTGIRPPWAKAKQYIARHGGHIFYADKT